MRKNEAFREATEHGLIALAEQRAKNETQAETIDKLHGIITKLEADNAAKDAAYERLERQAIKDRKLRDEAQSDAVLWQFSVDVGEHPTLLVMVWKQRKAFEAKLALAEQALTEIASFTQTTDLLWWQERARAVLGGKPS